MNYIIFTCEEGPDEYKWTFEATYPVNSDLRIQHGYTGNVYTITKGETRAVGHLMPQTQVEHFAITPSADTKYIYQLTD